MKKLIVLLMLFVPMLASAQTANEISRRLELGEALYLKGQYAEAEREFGFARQAAEGANSVRREEIMYLQCRSAYMAGLSYTESLLAEYLENYYKGVHFAEVAMMLGEKLLASGENVWAALVLSVVKESMLPKDRRDEYRFKSGYARVLGEEYARANYLLAKIDSTSYYFHSAQYLMAYADYAAGRYDEARGLFKTTAEADNFQEIIPFYMMQLDFAQGRWRAVVDNSARIVVSTDTAKVTEAKRMVGIAMYRLKNWRGAAVMLAEYEKNVNDSVSVLTRDEEYMLGVANYMSGYDKIAERYLRRVVLSDDTMTQNASYILGDIYIKEGNNSRAMQSFLVASAMNYDAAIQQDALLNYSKLSYEEGDDGHFNEAINIMKHYIATYPSSSYVDEIRGYLVAAYYNAKDYEEAMRLVSQIKNPDPVTRIAKQKITYWRGIEQFRKGDLDGAMAFFEASKRERADAKYTALSDFWEGEIMYRKGRYADAIEKYNAYLKVAPPDEVEAIEAGYNIGYAYFNQKKWAEAIGYFDAFLAKYKIDDEFKADALNRRGDIEYLGKSYWKAIEFYTKAASYDVSARYYAQFQRAMMFGLVDRTVRKIESLKEIIALGKGSYLDDATFELGRTAMAQQRYGEAIEIFDTLFEQYPSSPYFGDGAVYQGLAYRNLKDADRAEEAYKRVLMRERNTQASRDALSGIRDIYTERGDVDGYVRYAQSIEHQTIAADTAAMVEQIAERERIAAERARIEKEQADYEAIEREFAADNLDEAEGLIMAFSPQSNYLKAKAFLRLGDIYVKRGDTFQARATYQSIVTGYPDPSDGIIDEAKARINGLK